MRATQGAEPTVRSNFHLGLDPEKVKKMALDAGFSRTLAWYSVRPTADAYWKSLLVVTGAVVSSYRRCPSKRPTRPK